MAKSLRNLSELLFVSKTNEHQFIIFTQNTAEQWNKVFNINAIFYIAPAIFFIFFGSGKIQRWNDLEAARLKDLEAEQTETEMK